MKHPWTTVGGICTIIATVASLLAKVVLSKTIPSEAEFGAAFAAISTGVGLIKASDAKPADPPKAGG